MSDQKTEVSEFFNEISDTYKSKYSDEDPFLSYFFNERLMEATRGFRFENKKVLDIGAGTGDLFDALESQNPDYYACDIAAQMLESSNIPKERRFVGACHDIEFPVSEFDYIFMLGVSTYLPEDELERTLAFVDQSLAENGRFLVTFTNGSSIDWFFRRIIKSVLSKTGNRSNVLGQGFQIYPLSQNAALDRCGKYFSNEDTRWLNHTVFPFYHVSKSLSARLATSLHKRIGNGFIANVLSSDFMLVLQRKDRS